MLLCMDVHNLEGLRATEWHDRTRETDDLSRSFMGRYAVGGVLKDFAKFGRDVEWARDIGEP